MTATLDDQVRLMEPAWFMSYPHDVYARLRREAPVYWSPRDGLWAISKYDDVRWVSKNPAGSRAVPHLRRRREGDDRARRARRHRLPRGAPSCARSRRSVPCTPTTS